MAGFFIYQKQQHKTVTSYEGSFIVNFEECAKLSDSKIIETYPRQCEGKDQKTYIEEIKEPIDTSSWQTVDTKLGFSFKCPPKWKCDVFDKPQDAYVAKAYIDDYIHYYLNFSIIKAENFQKSSFRHPNYKNGVEWFKALLARDPKSVKVLPKLYYEDEAKGQIGPIYGNFKLDEIQDIEIDHKKAVILSVKFQ